MLKSVYVSPSGVPGLYERQPSGYVAPSIFYAEPSTTLAQAQTVKLAELAHDRAEAENAGIGYVPGSATATVRFALGSNFAATYTPAVAANPSATPPVSAAPATLTQTTPAPLVVDGAYAMYGDRVLLMGQTDPTQNGIYSITDMGDAASGGAIVLTQTSDVISVGSIIQSTVDGEYWQLESISTTTVVPGASTDAAGTPTTTTSGDTTTTTETDTVTTTETKTTVTTSSFVPYTPPYMVATDLESQMELTQAMKRYDLDSFLPKVWKLMNNVWIQLAAITDLQNLFKTVDNHVEACYYQEYVLASQVNAATSVTGVVAINWISPTV